MASWNVVFSLCRKVHVKVEADDQDAAIDMAAYEIDRYGFKDFYDFDDFSLDYVEQVEG